jgi:phage tail sheath protein FI
MPEYLAPGVYVEEVDSGSKPIEGVSTSTAGMVGVTERGPLDVPILVTGVGEFRRWFGERLDALDFPDGHSHLPHAVEGFFTNGGKRLYITRVIDSEQAKSAGALLFDRGQAPLADTILLRPAGESSGTTTSPPLLVVLSKTNLGVNDWLRIGDGSPSEYVQVATAPVAETVLVPLALPLSRSHAGVAPDDVQQVVTPVWTAGVALAAAAVAGAAFIDVTGAVAADITALQGAGVLLEIDGVGGEHRIVAGVTTSSPTTARVHLDSALLLAHRSGVAVRRLTLPAAASSAKLDPDARAGAALVFVDNRAGALATRNDLVIVAPFDGASREVRRIGELDVATIAPPPVVTHPAGSLVEAVQMAEGGTTLTPTASVFGDMTLTAGDVSELAGGQEIVVGGAETLVVAGINTATNVLTLRTGVTVPAAAGTAIVPLRRLTADGRAGATFLALDNRLGLDVGQVLRVGAAPNEEYVVVAALPSRAPAGVRPDAGNVVLEAPLALDHARPTTTVVRLAAPTSAGLQPTVLAVAALDGDGAVLLGDGNGYVANTLVRVTSDGVSYHRVATAATAAAPQMVELTAPTLRAHPAGSPVIERQGLLEVGALDPGAWGNRLRLSVEDEAAGLVPRTTLASFGSPTHVRLASSAGVEAGTILELMLPDVDDVVGALQKVVSVNRATGELILAATGLDAAQQTAQAAAVLAGKRLGVRSREFRVTVRLLRQPDALVPSRGETVIDSEVFRNLSMDVRHSRYAPTVIGSLDGKPRLADRRPEGESWYVRVRDTATAESDLESVRPGPEALVDVLPDGRRRAARHALVAGGDSIGTLTDDMYVGKDDPVPEQRTGLHSLRNIEEIAIVAVPGRTEPALQSALINHCELMRYRFAVLDSPAPNDDSLNDVQNLRQQYDTKYAAIYYPWVTIPDPFPQTTARAPELPVPPSGHMLGVYARTDVERGVHKAPANEVVRGIVGLRRLITKEQQDILNPFPVNINVIRDFRPDNRGLRVYGGRVITSDSDFKYVNVRRLLIFIEHSIDRGLQWVVFEPNAEPLWARVRRSISNFLTLVWRNGGLEGTKAEEAYFVKCDRTTMTQTDIDSGRLICQVGIAPVKPAEFVIVRIGLWTANADN